MPRWYPVPGLCDVTIQNIEMRAPIQFHFVRVFTTLSKSIVSGHGKFDETTTKLGWCPSNSHINSNELHWTRKTSQLAPFDWNLAYPLQKLVFKEPEFEIVCALHTTTGTCSMTLWVKPSFPSMKNWWVMLAFLTVYAGRISWEWGCGWNKEKNKPIHQGIDWAFSCKNKLKFNQASRIFTGSVPLLLFLVQLRVRIANDLFWYIFLNMQRNHNFSSKNKAEIHMSCKCNWKLWFPKWWP